MVYLIPGREGNEQKLTLTTWSKLTFLTPIPPITLRELPCTFSLFKNSPPLAVTFLTSSPTNNFYIFVSSLLLTELGCNLVMKNFYVS